MSFESLYDHEPFLRRLVENLVQDPQTVDDVVQDTFVAAWRQAPGSVREPRAWLARVARNLLSNRQRAQRRRLERERRQGPERASDPIDQILADRERRAVLLNALDHLRPRDREAVVWRFLDELSYREISERTGLDPDGARSRVRRGLAELRAHLERDARHSDRSWLLPLVALWRPAAPRRLLLVVAATLLLCCATALLLLARGGDARPSGRDTATAPRAAGGSRAASDVPATVRAEPVDDDPNRVPGPPVRIVGRVLADGRPLSGADVAAGRAYDVAGVESQVYRLQSAIHLAHLYPPVQRFEPLARAVTDAEGRFELVVARRTRLTVEASHPGRAAGNLLVVVPMTGDPPAVSLDLEHARVLSGVVTDGRGAPVADARIRAHQSGWTRAPVETRARTDATGRFRLMVRSPDVLHRLRLRVRKEGFADLHREIRPARGSDGTPRAVWLRLRREGALRGRVATRSGDPVAQARVRFIVPSDSLTWHVQEVTTDEDGRYHATELPALPLWRIEIYPDPNARFPGGVHLRSDIVPSAPEPTVHDIRYDATTVTGRAVDAAGGPVAGARVDLLAAQGPVQFLAGRTRTGADGRFALPHLPGGEYSFRVTAPGLARRPGELRASQGTLVNDVAWLGDVDPPPPTTVVLVPAGAMTVRFGGRELRTSPWGDAGSTLLGVQGRLLTSLVHRGGVARFDHVPASDDVRIWTPGMPDTATPYGPYRVAHGETTDITIPAAAPHAVVQVEVRDGEDRPLAGVNVGVFARVPETAVRAAVADPFLVRSGVFTDASGGATIEVPEFARGTYRNGWTAAAWAPGYVTAVAAGSPLPVDDAIRLRLTRGLSLSGRVRTADGAKAGGVEIEWIRPDALARGQLAAQAGARTGSGGRFIVSGLDAGAYLVRACTPRRVSPALLVDAGTTNLELRLTDPLEQLEVVVVRPNGFGHRNAMVGTIGSDRWPYIVSTTANGACSLRVPAGQHALRVVSADRRNPFPELRIPPVETGPSPRVLQVGPSPRNVWGVVYDADGRPLDGALVVGRGATEPGGDRDAPFFITDEHGRFDAGQAAEVDLLVVARGHAPHVQPLQPHRGDLRIRLARGRAVAGTLVGDGTEPVPGAGLRIVPLDAAATSLERELEARVGVTKELIATRAGRTTRSGEDGAFRFDGLADGAYAIVSSEPATRVAVPTRVRAGVPTTVRTVASRDVTGRLDVAGVALAGARVTAFYGEIPCGHAPVDEKGAFRLRGAPSSVLRLSVDGPVRGEAILAAGDSRIDIPAQPRSTPRGSDDR